METSAVPHPQSQSLINQCNTGKKGEEYSDDAIKSDFDVYPLSLQYHLVYCPLCSVCCVVHLAAKMAVLKTLLTLRSEVEWFLTSFFAIAMPPKM